MRRFNAVVLTVFIVLGLMGCEGESGIPTAPGLGHLQYSADQGSVSLWGLYQIGIDTRTWDAVITPMRSPDFTVDVVSFMQPPMGKTSNLKLEVTDVSEWADQGIIGIDVVLTHPFPGLDMYTGHDVMGVLVSPGSKNGVYDDSVWYTNGVDDCKLLNADGYTRWMNPVEFMPDNTIFNFVPGIMGTGDVGLFNATINGYKYYADGITADQTVNEYYSDPTNVHNRGQFRAGAANRRNYHIQFPYDSGPILVFQYAVIAHWVMPVDLDPSDIPGSFPLSANADEPIYMEIVDDNSDLWFTGSDGGGGISLDIEIYDQGAAHNPGGLLSEISSLIIEFDDPALNPLPSGFVSFSSSDLTAVPGSSDISSVVTVEVDNCEPKDLATGNLILTVESSNPTTYDPGTGNPPTSAKLAGYSYLDYIIQVANEVPFAEPVDDLRLKVNRVAGGTAFESLQLDWTNTNGEEYAVYQDSDPYDNGGIINIDYSTPVMLVSGSPAIISTFDHNGAYVFMVRVRKTAGDAGSESTDSNLALVELDDGGSETDAGNWLMGGNSIYYGQMRMSRGATYGNNGGWGYFVDNGLWANACMVMWSSLSTPQVPDIPGATESYIEWAHNYYDCWKAATFPGCTYSDNYPGFTGGGATDPAPEPVGYADPGLTWMAYDIFYNSPDDPPGGFGHPATHVGYNNISIYGIFGTPTTSAIWHGTDQTWKMSRVNAGITSDTIDYAAVTCSTYTSLNNWSANEGHYYMDDLAVVVY